MTPTEERAAIEAAWLERNPEITAGAWDAVYDWQDDYDRFHAMLDAGAHLDAVMLLIPRGHEWEVGRCHDGMYSAEVWSEDAEMSKCAEEPTPALALLTAFQRLAAIQKIGEQG